CYVHFLNHISIILINMSYFVVFLCIVFLFFFFFFQAEDGIRAGHVTGVQTCALPILYEILVGSALVFLAALSILQIVPWIAVLGLVAVLPLRRAIAILRLHYREYPAHIPANAAT